MRGLANSPNVEVPPFATEYSTDAGSHGVRGGTAASDAEAQLEKELEARGDDAAATTEYRPALPECA